MRLPHNYTDDTPKYFQICFFVCSISVSCQFRSISFSIIMLMHEVRLCRNRVDIVRLGGELEGETFRDSSFVSCVLSLLPFSAEN